MAYIGFDLLPDISSLDFADKQSTRKLQEYFFQLTEQLKYVLTNLDEDNLADGLAQTIDNAYTISASAAANAKEASSSNTEAKAFAQKLSPVLDYAGSVLTIKATGVNTQSADNKTNIADATDFYTDFDALRPVTYAVNGTTHLGLLASEVGDVCGLAVGDGGIDYNKLMVVLIGEIKALRGRVQTLENGGEA